MIDIEKALDHDDARKLAYIEQVVADFCPSVPSLHRRGAAQALVAGSTEIRLVVDGVGNVSTVDLSAAQQELVRRGMLHPKAVNPDAHAAEASARNDAAHHERLAQDAVAKRAVELLGKLNAIIGIGRHLTDTPSMWSMVAEYTDLRLQMALRSTLETVAEQLRVGAPEWLAALPALLANSPRSPQKKTASGDPAAAIAKVSDALDRITEVKLPGETWQQVPNTEKDGVLTVHLPASRTAGRLEVAAEATMDPDRAVDALAAAYRDDRCAQSEIKDEPLDVGDVVHLKGGGPSMTVYSVGANDNVICVWFNAEDKIERDSFRLAILRRV